MILYENIKKANLTKGKFNYVDFVRCGKTCLEKDLKKNQV